jgi:hypothetical protein
MSNSIFINLAFEDSLSESVLRVLLLGSGRSYEVATPYTGGGFGYLRQRVRGFNNAAKGIPFLLLTDLDTAECAPELVREWLPVSPHPNLLFRIAVRAVESWLLADRENLARFLGIRVELVPFGSDSIVDPKSVLIRLASRSRNRRLRDDIVPRPGSTSKQGPSYNGRLIAFVESAWDPAAASSASDSLRRTMEVLASFVPA